MSKRFKPVIKHDVVTQTYTIRDEKGIVIQVPDVIIDNLDSRYKTERDTLIDDLSWYKAKVSRLERENRFLLSRKDNLFDIWRDENKRSVALSKRLEQLERENKDLRLQSDTYFEQWQQHKTLNNEFSQHIGNKPSSSTYKYFRAKLDDLGVKEGEDYGV